MHKAPDTQSIDVLRFWRDVEVFTVPAAPRLLKSPSRHVAAYSHQDILPWSPHSPLAPLASGELIWSHAVFIGVAAKSSWARKILALACPGHRLTPSEFEQLTGAGWLAGFVVDFYGYAQAGSYTLASFALGVARLRQGKRLDGLRQAIDRASSSFNCRHEAPPTPAVDAALAPHDPAAVSQSAGPGAADSAAKVHAPIEDDGGQQDAPQPLVFSDLTAELQIAMRIMGDTDTQTRFDVIIASTLRRRRRFKEQKKQRKQQGDLAFLNSFYLDDLDRLLETAPCQGLQSRALTQFIAQAPHAKTRRDVLDDKTLMAHYAGPAHMSLGRWPANSRRPLMFAQQAVVGAILAELGDSAGLMAVNGPPGTGKTTLLCDIMADVVVKRGQALSRLDSPRLAFGPKRPVGGLPVFALRAQIAKHTGIVVASNNNAAVENITRILPATCSIDTQEHPGAAYLPQVAAHVFDVAGVTVQSWGLVAAALGNSDNRYKFSQAFFRDGRLEDPGRFAGLDLKAVLRCAPADAVARWQTARQAFLACEQQVRQLQKEAERVQTAVRAQTQHRADTLRRRALVDTLGAELAGFSEQRGPRGKALTLQLHSLAEAQSRADVADAHNAQIIDAYRRGGGRPADAAFFAAPACQQHLASLWVHPQLDLLRAQLFIKALELHEATLLACSDISTRNARAVRAMLARDTPEAIDDDQRATLWDFLFFCVPVVSTTLASFDRLFEGVAPASLGWLLLDEAGQATPQSIAGALWRSRRAVIIGDPMQVPPVMTAPYALVQELLRQHPIETCFSPATASAQTLADRSSPLGAFIHMQNGPPIWTGLPLRAHRRCIEPMFGVANQIAYAGQMVQANTAPSDIQCTLGASCWFDVVGSHTEHQLVQEELALLGDLIWQLQAAWPRLDTGAPASVFIVSPFRRVADAARALLRDADLGGRGAPIESGTVHRFQGREADIVFLVLGSATGAAGAGSRHWASYRPNLLNVALTRARLRLYVIGNVEDWARCRHFDVLLAAMQAQKAIVRASARQTA